MKPKGYQDYLLYAAYLIDGVIIYAMLLQNPHFFSVVQANLPFATRVLPNLVLITGLCWLSVSTLLVVLQILIVKHNFYQKERLKPELKNALFFLLLAISFFVGHFIFDNSAVIDYLVTTTFVCAYFISLSRFARIFTPNKDLSIDSGIKNKMDLIIASKQSITNEYSFNFKTSQGYLNIVNPFRGIYLVGTAGSGKTYSTIEPIIDQAFEKGYTAFIYDFKFPNLGEYAYNSYLLNSEKSGLKIPRFCVLYFKDPRYSNRCNPLHQSILSEKAYALQASKTILFNINPEWSKKQGEFFSTSAIALCQAIMWYLRMEAVRSGKNISTLPHLIEMASFHNTAMLVEVLLNEMEVATIITPIKAAMTAGAAEQLAGQIASLQIGLSQIVDKKMYYVMSDSDFSLDLNNPDDPKILVLGNDDALKQAYSPALSLYASTVANTINQKNRRHSLYCVDEFPTMYIMNVENLPNTGRSNKICTLLGLQNFYQSEQVYGKEASNVINSSFANIIMGQTNDEQTAKFAQNILGEYEYRKRDISLQFDSDGGSQSFRTDRKKVLNIDDMYELNAGTFVGKVADAGGEGREKKFFAKFNVVKQAHNNKLPVLNEALAQLNDTELEQILTEHTLKIKSEIIDLIVEKYFTIKSRLRFSSSTEINSYLNQKILSADYKGSSIEDLDTTELQRFESRRIEVAEFVIQEIVQNCIKTFHETEARGGKAVTEKLSVEEYCLRQNFYLQIPDGDGGKKDNPKAPQNLIDRFFRHSVTQGKSDNEIYSVSEQSIPIEDYTDQNEYKELLPEEPVDQMDRLNFYINQVKEIVESNSDLHDLIEEFTAAYNDSIEQISEYCRQITQGATTNVFEYTYSFVAFNSVNAIIKFHESIREQYDYLSEEETRKRVSIAITYQEEREPETDPLAEELPDFMNLAETALNGIQKSLKLEEYH